MSISVRVVCPCCEHSMFDSAMCGVHQLAGECGIREVLWPNSGNTGKMKADTLLAPLSKCVVLLNTSETAVDQSVRRQFSDWLLHLLQVCTAHPGADVLVST